MTDDEPQDPLRPRATDEALEEELASAERHAADDPTAMWDEDALRDAGMDDLVARARDSLPPAPATGPDVKGDSRDNVVLAAKAGGASPTGQSPPRPVVTAAGMSWPFTIALAVVLGLLVFALVRLIR